MINVLIWNEYIHEREPGNAMESYPIGIHGCLAEYLETEEDINVGFAHLDMENNGITEEILNNTDVLIWWGHHSHDKVSDDVVRLVINRINNGMGFIPLHAAHHSKIFKGLMGTTCNLKWRHGDRERIWTVNPNHPIATGVPEHFEIDKEEMYGEPFDIPNPDEVVFMGWFAGGEVFRSGVTYRRGAGKIFYFQPGHEEYPVYYNKNVRKIILNAIRWAAPVKKGNIGIEVVMAEKLEKNEPSD